MGQTDAPTLANIFVYFHEKKWLEECPPEFRPVLYRRYIDYTFLLFRDVRHIDLFLSQLNTCRECIKFIKKVEININLSFLDRSITKIIKIFNINLQEQNIHRSYDENFFYLFQL